MRFSRTSQPTLTEKSTEALERLFLKINAQQSQRGVVFRDMTSKEKRFYANECVLALSVEVSELASSWPFASWKTGKADVENIEREIIDCVFFLTNIACCFGIGPSDLIERFEVVLRTTHVVLILENTRR